MAWLVVCAGRSFLLNESVDRNELVNDLNAATAANRPVAVLLENNEELVFYPSRLDYLLYSAGTAVPRGTSMLTGQQPASPSSMLTTTPT